MSTKLIISILVFLIFCLGGFLIYEKYTFPIKYKVCNIAYSDCFVVAKFGDLDSCESAKEKGAWYCDTTTDPTKPNCRVEKSSISTSFCSE